MAIKLAAYLPFTVTQGAANAFAKADISTGIGAGSDIGLMIERVEVWTYTSEMQTIAADARFMWALAREYGLAAMPLSATHDDDVIYLDGGHVALTTSGQSYIPMLFTWDAPDGTLIVEPYISMNYLTAGFAGATIIMGRIYYQTVKIGELERLRILNRQ